MDIPRDTPNHRKRKRRRVISRRPLPAQLLIDGGSGEDVGLISEDLFDELFSNQHYNRTTDLVHVAISVNCPGSSPSPKDDQWIIFACKIHDGAKGGRPLPISSLRVPMSPALEAFLRDSPVSFTGRDRTNAIDIHVLDVIPIELETVIVSIDRKGFKRLVREVQEHDGTNDDGESPEEDAVSRIRSQLDSAVREALSRPRIIRQGDVLALPKSPEGNSSLVGVVDHSEPVLQGFITTHTKVVVTLSSKVHQHSLSDVTNRPNGAVKNLSEGHDSERYGLLNGNALTKKKAGASSDTSDEDASSEGDSDSSDGSGHGIRLSLPSLPSQMPSTISINGSQHDHGTASPGSAISGYSTFSSATMMSQAAKGRNLQVHGLLTPVSPEQLRPTPAVNEDDEARMLVDTATLAKLGCFSGDWVKISPVSGTIARHSAGNEDVQLARVAKIYALPNQQQTIVKSPSAQRSHRRISSVSSQQDKTPSDAYLSPIFLANLGSPSIVHVLSLTPPPSRRTSRAISSHNRITSGSSPPVASSITLLKYTTPLSLEFPLQSTLVMAARKYFEQKRRLVKEGDLIGIPIDTSLGRAVYNGPAHDDDVELDEILSKSYAETEQQAEVSGKKNVLWFKIRSIVPETRKDGDEDNFPWSNTFVVVPETTRRAQSGSEHGRVPDTTKSSWPYYLGTKRLPPSSQDDGRSKVKLKLPLPFISQTRRRIRELASVATSPQAIHFGLPPVAILLVSTQRSIGKATVATNACSDLGLHTFCIDSYDVVTESGAGDVKSELLLTAKADKALACGPEYTSLLIKHVETLNADRMIGALREILSKIRVLIATTTSIDKVPDGIRSLFTHEIEMGAPDEREREHLLQDIVRESGLPVSSNVEMSSIALKTAALVAGDLIDVVERATVASQERLEKLASLCNESSSADDPPVTVRDIQLAGGDAGKKVIKADFDMAVDAARKNFADAIGAPKIPNVGWADVGGLTNVKDAVMETIQLPLERPELFAKGMKKRSGILFYGPPGTGKTLLAKAIATEFSLNFFSVKGPELLNMYIGESEANVRRVFQRARDARPCVVFFDELDSVAPKRGNQGDSGGVMDRIVSQLLAELDGMSDDGGGVFVIGATNRPDLLDQALLRPGRFDKMLYLGVSDTHDKQQTILEALTRKFTLHPTLSLSDVAAALPFTYTGADLYALCSDAMLKAITRRATLVDKKVQALNAEKRASKPSTLETAVITTAYFFDHLASKEDTEVVVEEEDFMDAMGELVPSVSIKELEHYDGVRRSFEAVESGKKEREEAARRAPATLMNGVVKGKGRLLVNSKPPALNDDDFVLKTENLSLTNGDREASTDEYQPPKNKGKGKGKATSETNGVPDDLGFGNATNDDGQLYDL